MTYPDYVEPERLGRGPNTRVRNSGYERFSGVFCKKCIALRHQFAYTSKAAHVPISPSPYHSSNGGHVTFQVGDKVIYPNHGLGVVERIEDKTILGTTCGFYHLRILANETTVLVPVPNVDGVGLRRAISDEEVERLFGLLGDGKIDNHQNWKGRFKDNSDKMRSGSIYDVADVLKSLTFLARSKSLSFREKRMLDRAKFLIISEVSEVMRETSQQIEGRVEQALERWFLRQGARGAACDDRPREARTGAAREDAPVAVVKTAPLDAAQRRGRSPDRARVVAVFLDTPAARRNDKARIGSPVRAFCL